MISLRKTTEQKAVLTVKAFKIDIGDDGGTLERTAAGDWLIDGEPATPEQVDAWIHHWHTLQDAAMESDEPCICASCTRHRERPS